MAKDTVTAPDVPVAVVPDAFPLTLDEFCSRKSATDQRVEMIAGFHFSEVRAGKTQDTEAAFTARYNAFCTRPSEG